MFFGEEEKQDGGRRRRRRGKVLSNHLRQHLTSSVTALLRGGIVSSKQHILTSSCVILTRRQLLVTHGIPAVKCEKNKLQLTRWTPDIWWLLLQSHGPWTQISSKGNSGSTAVLCVAPQKKKKTNKKTKKYLKRVQSHAWCTDGKKQGSSPQRFL